MAIMSVAASAQDFKWAYVDFNELVMLMPEMDAARATMEENQKTNEEILVSMYEEYQTKAQQYQHMPAKNHIEDIFNNCSLQFTVKF